MLHVGTPGVALVTTSFRPLGISTGWAQDRIVRPSGEPFPVLGADPDFPPSHGGIHFWLHRSWRDDEIDTTVVTLTGDGGRTFDATQCFGGPAGRQTRAARALSVASLNPTASASAFDKARRGVVRTYRLQPGCVRSSRAAHSPVIHTCTRRRSTGGQGCAIRDDTAERVVAITGITRVSRLSLGAAPRSLRVLPPGVDLPASA